MTTKYAQMITVSGVSGARMVPTSRPVSLYTYGIVKCKTTNLNEYPLYEAQPDEDQ